MRRSLPASFPIGRQSGVTTPSSNEANQKLSRNALIALVIGSMVGSGIFALPASFGRATGALGAMIAWVIAGAGMLMLAFVFQALSRRRPDLDAGIYAYATAGFGDYLGFASAAGYWIGCCLADVACLVLIKATLGQFFPIFGDGTTPTAIAAASVLLWGVHFLVLRGIKGAAALNTVAFDPELFRRNFWGTEQPEFSNVLGQVRSTMLLTVFVFVGIEGASVYSRYATNRTDIGIATVVGFLTVLLLLVLVTLLSYGVLPRLKLETLRNPSMAGVMESMIGPWGGVFISVGLLISILGNYLSWSLLAAEVLHSAAVHRTMPSFLARQNACNVPAGALWLTNFEVDPGNRTKR
jgi:arginine:ornithine antiporter/lysine permease